VLVLLSKNKLWLLLVLIIGLAFSKEPTAAKGYQTKVFATAAESAKGWLELAPDGRRFGFVYFKNGRHFVQVNNKVYGDFEIGESAALFIKFGPDGKSLAFSYFKNGQYFLHLNDQVLGGYSQVEPPVFGPAGKTVWFRYAKGDKWYLWINGEVYGGYQEVEPPILTTDETGYGFAFRKWSRWYFQINNRKYGRYRGHWGPFLSGGGQTFGFAGQKSEAGQVDYYLGGKRFGPVDRVLQFNRSVDGKSFDVFYESQGQSFLHVGETYFGPFTGLSFPKSAANFVETNGGVIYQRDKYQYLQYGEKIYGGYLEISPIRAGPRHQLWGFCYRRNAGYYARIGNSNYGPFPAVVDGPYFSPNEKAFAFLYRYRGEIYININNRVYREPDTKDFAILDLASSDSGRVVALKFRKNGREFIRVGKIIYGGRGTIYPGSLTVSSNGVCFGYRYRYQEREYVQINEKVFQSDDYQSGDFVITPDNKACFVRVKNGKVIMEEVDYSYN
jgi:hypothetical protein